MPRLVHCGSNIKAFALRFSILNYIGVLFFSVRFLFVKAFLQWVLIFEAFVLWFAVQGFSIAIGFQDIYYKGFLIAVFLQKGFTVAVF